MARLWLGQRASRMCSRSRSRSKVTWYGHFCAGTKIAPSHRQIAVLRPNLHRVVSRWACIQGVLKVKVKKRFSCQHKSGRITWSSCLWPWAHPGCWLTWKSSCASLVAIRLGLFACEKKQFSCQHKNARITWPWVGGSNDMEGIILQLGCGSIFRSI